MNSLFENGGRKLYPIHASAIILVKIENSPVPSIKTGSYFPGNS